MFLHTQNVPVRNTDFLELVQERMFRWNGRRNRKKNGTCGIPENPSGIPGVSNLRRNSMFQDFAAKKIGSALVQTPLVGPLDL